MEGHFLLSFPTRGTLPLWVGTSGVGAVCVLVPKNTAPAPHLCLLCSGPSKSSVPSTSSNPVSQAVLHVWGSSLVVGFLPASSPCWHSFCAYLAALEQCLAPGSPSWSLLRGLHVCGPACGPAWRLWRRRPLPRVVVGPTRAGVIGPGGFTQIRRSFSWAAPLSWVMAPSQTRLRPLGRPGWFRAGLAASCSYVVILLLSSFSSAPWCLPLWRFLFAPLLGLRRLPTLP